MNSITITKAVQVIEPFADHARNQIRKCINRNKSGRHFFVAIRYRYSDTPGYDQYPNILPVPELLKIGRGKDGGAFVGDFMPPWDTADIAEVTIRPGNTATEGRVRLLLTVRRPVEEKPAPVETDGEDEDDGGWFGVRTLADAMGDE